MRLITFDDIQDLNIDPIECYRWVSEMISNKKSAYLPAKISMHPTDNVFCNVMPCIIPETVLGNIGGVKVVNRYPERNPSLDSMLLLFNTYSKDFV